jgi:hypothetical protein
MRRFLAALGALAIFVVACGDASIPDSPGDGGVSSPAASTGGPAPSADVSQPSPAATTPGPQEDSRGTITVTGEEFEIVSTFGCRTDAVNSGNEGLFDGLSLQAQATSAAVLTIHTGSHPDYSPGGGILYDAERSSIELQEGGTTSGYHVNAVTNEAGDWGVYTDSLDFEPLAGPPLTMSDDRITGAVTLTDDDGTAVDVSFDVEIPSGLGSC